MHLSSRRFNFVIAGKGLIVVVFSSRWIGDAKTANIIIYKTTANISAFTVLDKGLRIGLGFELDSMHFLVYTSFYYSSQYFRERAFKMLLYVSFCFLSAIPKRYETLRYGTDRSAIWRRLFEKATAAYETETCHAVSSDFVRNVFDNRGDTQ